MAEFLLLDVIRIPIDV